MPTFYTNEQAALLNARSGQKRQVPNALTGQGKKLALYKTYTPTGTEVAADIIELGVAGVAGMRLIPEQCRIRFGGSGTGNIAATLQRRGVNTLETTWTRVTTTATFTSRKPHGYITGQSVTISSTSDAAAVATGAVTVTVTGPNTFTATCLNAGATQGGAIFAPIIESLSASLAINAGAGATVTFVAAAGVFGVAQPDDVYVLLLGTVTAAFTTTRRLEFEGEGYVSLP
jgi:hypothetical protein